MGLFPSFEVFISLLLVGAITIFFLYRKFRELHSISSACVLSKDWSAWGDCSRNCGNEGWQFSTKSILSLEKEGGAPCKIEDMLRSQSCPGNTLQCGKACVPGDPSIYTWSSCPLCLQPNQLPLQYKIVPPLSPATTGGVDCNVDDVFFSRPCNNVVQACPPDIDCELQLYASSSCALGPCENSGQTGLQFLYFRVSQQKSGRGTDCDYRQLVQVAACPGDPAECNCSENSEDWGEFSECNASCGPGVKVSLRKDPSDQCPNVSFTTCSYGPCDNSTCIPPSIDLVRAECYLRCAGLPLSEFPAGLCSSSSILDTVCKDFITGTGDCAEPQNCSLSTWSQFAPCPQQCTPENLFGTVTQRSRYIVQPSVGGGIPCTDPSLITRDYEPCANWVNVSYTKFNTDTNNFEKSVSLAQCFTQTCTYSDWYSVTQCQNPQMCSDSNFPLGTITYNRSITGGGDCFTDPSQFFSFTSCTLPACIDCLWADDGADAINDLTRSAFCTKQKLAQGFLANTLVSQTNRFNETCQDYEKKCSYNAGQTLSPEEQQTCSVFFWDCPNTQNCPQDSEERICSNNGFYEFYSSASTFSCRCSCFPGWAGVSCSTNTGNCPIATISGLQCNGMGSCTENQSVPGTFFCQCYNSSNTSADCSGGNAPDSMDRGWCWIYETVKTLGTLDTGLTLKKLLGAQRISQQFTFDQCTQLSANSQNLRSILSSMSGSFTNVTIVTPKNMNFNLGAAPLLNQSNIFQVPILNAYLEGVVNSKSPPNLLLANSQSLYYTNVNDLTTQEILLALGYPKPVNEGTVSANYLSFKPIAVKNSIPVTVESPLFFSSFQNPLTIPSSLPSLSNPVSQTQFLEPPQIGNVESPLNAVYAPGPGTYTQVRWLTFEDFIGNSPGLDNFSKYIIQNSEPVLLFPPLQYKKQEGYVLKGAFAAESFNWPSYIGEESLDYYFMDHFFTLTFFGSITKFFNDSNSDALKATVPCLTVSFPYLQTNTDVKPYKYEYRFGVPRGREKPDFLPNSNNLYSDSTLVALMNYGQETSFDYYQLTPKPFVPSIGINYFLTSCIGFGFDKENDNFPPGTFRGYNDCLRNRYLYNPLTASLLNNETMPIELKSHRRTSQMIQDDPNSFNWSSNPCMTNLIDPAKRAATPLGNSLVDESLNHPECTVNYIDIDQTPAQNPILSLSSYECKPVQQIDPTQPTEVGLHRTNPLGTVFTCKLFQWFVKYGKGSSMPIVVSYNYNNT